MHGYLLGKENLPAPRCTVQSEALARRDCDTGVKASEYEDHPAVLERKAELLVSMWTAAERPLVYTGAGISTASGIQDYASSAQGSRVQPTKKRLTYEFIHSLQPTAAHRVLTEMEKQGLVWGWLQQNHDGLAQKAGFPASRVNEIHGSWLDKEHNPIIAMSGSLRGDLFDWMLEMEKQCDFVFACGTSFSGLNADRCAATCASRHMKKKRGQGLAVLSVQKTTKDDVAALRIYSKIDAFMTIVARKLGTISMPLPATVHKYAAPAQPTKAPDADAWKAERKLKRAAFENEWGKKVPAETTANVAPITTTERNSVTKCSAATAAMDEDVAAAEPASGVVKSQARVGNTHRLLQSSGGDTSSNNKHGWTMRVAAPAGTLKSVTFSLHPTFSPAQIHVKQPISRAEEEDVDVFELPERHGWGTFDVGVEIVTKNGRSNQFTHELSFDGHGAFRDVEICV